MLDTERAFLAEMEAFQTRLYDVLTGQRGAVLPDGTRLVPQPWNDLAERLGDALDEQHAFVRRLEREAMQEGLP